MNTYTELETTVMTAIKNHSISFFDAGVEVDSNSWIDCLIDDMGSSKTYRGVVTSMIKKGFFESDGEAVFLTEEAVRAINAL